MDQIKKLVETVCLVWKENGFYKPSKVKLFGGNEKEVAETILEALDGYNIYSAINILECCKMALKQAPICLKTEGEANEEQE